DGEPLVSFRFDLILCDILSNKLKIDVNYTNRRAQAAVMKTYVCGKKEHLFFSGFA
ncbi:hypothetical protein P7K49_038691, partial [Saguinus oedipus]